VTSSTSATVSGPGTLTANFQVVVQTYAVTFNEGGLPSGTSWCVSLASFGQSCGTGTSISYSSISAGSYSYSVTPPGCGSGCQYTPSPSSGSVSVPSQTSVSISFTKQYYLTMTSSGLSGCSVNCIGPVSPTSGYHNADAVVTISAQATTGEGSFDYWSGSGSGSYSGSDNPATVTMSGPITENGVYTSADVVIPLPYGFSSLLLLLALTPLAAVRIRRSPSPLPAPFSVRLRS